MQEKESLEGRGERERVVEAMRRAIITGLDRGITPAEAADAVGYSQRHASRIFKEVTGKSMREYIRLLRLTHAAEALAKDRGGILETALDHRFDSHEGFTKAFRSAFGICPTAYRQGGRPIPYFIPYPVGLPPEFFTGGKDIMSQITVTFVERSARKMILLYSETGTDYWSFCQEQGCDWEGLLRSIPERMDAPAFLALPKQMIPTGKALGAVGIEVPADWQGQPPKGYDIIDLPPISLAYFQSPPYEKEDDFPQAIGAVFAAYEGYKPEPYGYVFAETEAPVMNFGAYQESGARIAVPVKRK